jgi:hypothetical protein
MTQNLFARTAVTLIGAALVSLSFSGVAVAREGSSSKSVGHGIKCSNVAVRNADGTTTVTRVCRKGV